MSSIYAVGPLRLDAQTFSLTLNGQPTGLGPRAVRLLHALVVRANEYVSKGDLLDAAWPGLVVEEANLSVQMSAIRKVLAQAGDPAVKIETLSRRGYRFVGTVSTEAPIAGHNLPQALTSFIGREREIEEVERLFAATRLLTLTGAGGAGKTRLALQIAADLLVSRRDGVWLTELAAIADPERVAQTVAVSLGVAEQPGKTPTDALVAHLASRRLVLVLDNAEHLLEACADLVHVILRRCAHVSVLATSREPLGIEGEVVYRVPPMAVPDPKPDASPHDISGYESVRLFVERARLHRPNFEMGRENARAVASICRRLDGIPLSLELAAARVRSMTVEEIDRRLDQRFRLLAVGARTAAPRQQTLRSLIDWSVGLLDEAEKALLFRASVFAGGWTLEGAEEVCVGAPIADATAVDETLAALVDKSLVQTESREGTTRFRLLETVRQYARESLEEGDDASRWRSSHLAHMVHLAEEAEPHLTGGEQQAWLERLDAEHDNVRAALAWSSSAGGDPGSGLRLAAAFWRFWYVRGYVVEGRDWLSKGLAASADAGHAGGAVRARALIGCATLAQHQGDRTAARTMLEEGLGLARALGEAGLVGSALNSLGTIALLAGKYAQARALYEESLSVRRTHGDSPGVAAVLGNLGNLAHFEGDFAAAQALHEESLVIERRLANRWGIATSLDCLGLALENLGDHAGARRAFEESLAIQRALGNRSGIGNSLNNLGNVACEQGDYATAQRLYEETLALQRELGEQELVAAALDNLALIAAEQRDFAAARSLLEEALAIRSAMNDRRGIASCFEGLAYVAFALGRGAPAAALIWGAAARMRDDVGCPLPAPDRERSEHRIAAARAAMGDDAAFDRAWHEGRDMPLDEALAFVLETLSSPATAHARPPRPPRTTA